VLDPGPSLFERTRTIDKAGLCSMTNVWSRWSLFGPAQLLELGDAVAFAA
jgi:hypothetical protein